MVCCITAKESKQRHHQATVTSICRISFSAFFLNFAAPIRLCRHCQNNHTNDKNHNMSTHNGRSWRGGGWSSRGRGRAGGAGFSTRGRGNGNSWRKRDPEPKPDLSKHPLGSLLATLSYTELIGAKSNDNTKISDCEYVASYNWLNTTEPNILVPGRPSAVIEFSRQL